MTSELHKNCCLCGEEMPRHAILVGFYTCDMCRDVEPTIEELEKETDEQTSES
jgi:hypothetical protein